MDSIFCSTIGIGNSPLVAYLSTDVLIADHSTDHWWRCWLSFDDSGISYWLKSRVNLSMSFANCMRICVGNIGEQKLIGIGSAVQLVMPAFAAQLSKQIRQLELQEWLTMTMQSTYLSVIWNNSQRISSTSSKNVINYPLSFRSYDYDYHFPSNHRETRNEPWLKTWWAKEHYRDCKLTWEILIGW